MRWFVVLIFSAGWFLLDAASAVEPPKPVAEAEVREQESAYRQERAAAEKSGLLARSSPEPLVLADQLAEHSATWLKAGRLGEAYAAIHRARWLLPSKPRQLPAHVT